MDYSIMPHHARNHMQNRKRVCILCMKKGLDKITHLILERIYELVVGLENYDPSDPQFPHAICGNCRHILTDISMGKKLPPVCLEYLIIDLW